MISARQSFYVTYCICSFVYVEPFLYLSYEVNLVMVNDILDLLLNSVFEYFIEKFASRFIRDIDL